MTERSRLLLPVNWWNALAYYSQGLVVPCEALARHRPDLLELAPRRLPILIGGISGSAAERCGTAPGDFPVVLEIGSDVSVRGEELQSSGRRIATAPAGVIPTSHVSWIHVRSDPDGEEFRARRYRNIDAERLPVTTSPALFSCGTVQAETLDTWLRGLPDPGRFRQGDLAERQCVAGALMLTFTVVPPHAGPPDGAWDLLEAVLADIGTGDVLGLLAKALAEVGWIHRGDDLAICAAAIAVLAEMSGSEPPVVSEVLRNMRALLADMELSDPRRVAAHLDRILAIDRGDAVFARFRDVGGLSAAKGLLLFLLRPDPSAVKTWREEDVNACGEIISLAAAYAGIAHRSTGLPTELRGSPSLQHLLHDWIAEGMNAEDIGIPHSASAAAGSERRGATWY